MKYGLPLMANNVSTLVDCYRHIQQQYSINDGNRCGLRTQLHTVFATAMENPAPEDQHWCAPVQGWQLQPTFLMGGNLLGKDTAETPEGYRSKLQLLLFSCLFPFQDRPPCHQGRQTGKQKEGKGSQSWKKSRASYSCLTPFMECNIAFLNPGCQLSCGNQVTNYQLKPPWLSQSFLLGRGRVGNLLKVTDIYSLPKMLVTDSRTRKKKFRASWSVWQGTTFQTQPQKQTTVYSQQELITSKPGGQAEQRLLRVMQKKCNCILKAFP